MNADATSWPPKRSSGQDQANGVPRTRRYTDVASLGPRGVQADRPAPASGSETSRRPELWRGGLKRRAASGIWDSKKRHTHRDSVGCSVDRQPRSRETDQQLGAFCPPGSESLVLLCP
jgi:hypothetical protein